MSSQGEEQIDPSQAWLNVAGTNKGNIYGLGAAQSLYFERSSKGSGPGKSDPYEASRISQLEATNKALQDRLDAESEARERQYQELKRMMDALQSNCSMFGPPPYQRDPRDPGDGGGASSFFPVQPPFG